MRYDLSKKFTVSTVFTSLIANLIGASLTIIYFRFFNFIKVLSFEDSSKVPFDVILTILVFAGIIYVARHRIKRIAFLIKKLEQNEIGNQETIELKKNVLNQSFFSTVTTFFGWFSASIIIPISFVLQGNSWQSAFFLFLVIFFIGGSLSMVVTFFLCDSYLRKLVIAIFPDGDFKDVQGVKYVRISLRMMNSFWIGGILPILMFYFFSSNYINQLRTEGYNETVEFQYHVSIGFLVVLSVFMSILFSVYYSRHIGKPLVKMQNGMKAIENGNLDVFVEVDHKDEIGNVCTGFNSMTKGLKDRERIKDVFGKFVSSEIRDEVLKGDLELGGEKREATILFCDIRNFTTLSENLKASEVVNLLNSYFDEIVKPIFNNQGVLDKFIGDAIMAVFGPPSNYQDHAVKATKAALAMFKKLELFNSKIQKEGHEPISIGIGINTGEVISGNIGSTQRMEYTVIGDSVNIASRLEGLTKRYDAQIIISEYTRRILKNSQDFTLKELDLVKVKGRKQPLRIFTVLEDETNITL